MSVDTNVARRRDTSRYLAVDQDGVRLLISKNLASNMRYLRIDMRRTLFFFRQLYAQIELLEEQPVSRGLSSA